MKEKRVFSHHTPNLKECLEHITSLLKRYEHVICLFPSFHASFLVENPVSYINLPYEWYEALSLTLS